MVLVRTETGQLVMVPQQFLAQAQAKTQQAQAGVTQRPATPTAATTTIRVSTATTVGLVPGQVLLLFVTVLCPGCLLDSDRLMRSRERFKSSYCESRWKCFLPVSSNEMNALISWGQMGQSQNLFSSGFSSVFSTWRKAILRVKLVTLTTTLYFCFFFWSLIQVHECTKNKKFFWV